MMGTSFTEEQFATGTNRVVKGLMEKFARQEQLSKALTESKLNEIPLDTAL